MTTVDLIMPKMGESIMEATILKWVKSVGDTVAEDETILEIATDKVDSEIPSPVTGKISSILFKENDVVPVGTVIAHIETESAGDAGPAQTAPVEVPTPVKEQTYEPVRAAVPEIAVPDKPQKSHGNGQPRIAREMETGAIPARSAQDRFYSPLVRNIARREGISVQELDNISGSGMHGRVTKRDIMAYVGQRTQPSAQPAHRVESPAAQRTAQSAATPGVTARATDENVEIIEMDRMRLLIAEHMVRSKQTSPHVTSFVEADVTEMVKWREKVKDDFLKQYGEKITFTPLFIEAVAKSIRDFPMINISVEGTQLIRKKDIHIGMAAALPSGNLIVPVIRNADQLNLYGLTKAVNDFAERARNNKLKPEEIQGGTFTLTNVGTFGNVMGTPIINQPQVAILATGAIRKRPAVVETQHGDLIAVRHMMFLSLSYDHRVVDGYLGGSFLRRIADYLEAFDPQRAI